MPHQVVWLISTGTLNPWGNGTKDAPTKYTLCPEWLSVCHQAQLCTHSQTHTNGKTGLVQPTGFSSSVDYILPYRCVFCSMYRESNAFLTLMLLIYSSFIRSALFDGKLLDHHGGQHLKSLSGELGALGSTMCCLSISPMSEAEPGNQGKRKLPLVIGCYRRLIDCLIQWGLNLFFYRPTSGEPETWETSWRNARNSSFVSCIERQYRHYTVRNL